MPYDRLTALDASFLHLEDATSHMHVASVTIFEGAPPTHGELMDAIESRLSLVPRYRQKLRTIPFGQGRPVWVDDPHFNLDYHIRVTALPPPGTEDQLKRLAGRVFSQALDRTKPLWEIWLVEGLDRGEGGPDETQRFALLSKTHHALVDGIAGVDLTAVMFDTAPDAEAPPPSPAWHPRPEPTSGQLLAESLVERATKPAEIARSARAGLRAPRRFLERSLEGLAAVGSLARSGFGAPSSPLNVDIGPHRRFEWTRTDLDQLKAIKNALGGTVNDVVLATVSGALRRFLERRGEDVDELELKAMVPVSVRSAEERGMTGNRVAAMMATLPVYQQDPLERFRLVSEAMAGLKDSRQAVGAQMLTELSGFAPPTVLAQAARLQARQRFFNVVVTNVPGPQFDLYLLGRRLIDLFPMAPLAKKQALCIAVMSYSGRLNFGLLGDFDAMPDLDLFTRDIADSLDELRKAAGVRKPRLRARAPAPAASVEASAPGANGKHGAGQEA